MTFENNQSLVWHYLDAAMESHSKILNLLAERFPNDVDQTNWLFFNDPVFQEICSDYFYCASKVPLLQSESNDLANLDEYRRLETDLEEEIRKRILARKSHPR